jgi:hypothetical protein
LIHLCQMRQNEAAWIIAAPYFHNLTPLLAITFKGS